MQLFAKVNFNEKLRTYFRQEIPIQLPKPSTAKRCLYGRWDFMRPSPFIKEAAQAFTVIGQAPFGFSTRKASPYGQFGRDASAFAGTGASSDSEMDESLVSKWKKGTHVYHDDYGEGAVVAAYANSGEYVIEVQFATGNRRREMLNVVHNHLPAVLVYVGFGIDTGGIRAVIVQLVRRGAGRIDQHGGAIGENVIERFTATAVDGMDIHISLCPGRHDLTHFELLGGGCLRGGGNNGPRGRVVLPAAAREDYGGERHE